MRRSLVPVAVLIAAATACGSTPEPTASGEPSATPTAVRCDPEVPDVFSNWELADEVEVPAQDRIGVRQTYVDDRRRNVTLMFGIRGETGEGLAPAGQRETATGAVASLKGTDLAWALVWREAGTCGDRTVLGAGFDQDGFEALMVEAGILAE